MRILLVSHEASRSGAPRVAVMVARQLCEQGHEVSVVVRYPGPLLEDFEAVAPTSVERLPRVRNRLRRTLGLSGLGSVLEVLVALVTILRRRPDLVYLNSTASAAYLGPARWLRRPTVLHVHESGSVARRFLSRTWSSRTTAGATLVACSPSVHSELAALLGRSPDDVTLLPSVPDDTAVLGRAAEPVALPYAAGELVVGACGTVERRKGSDLFEQVARRVRLASGDLAVRFVWVGDRPAPGEGVPDDSGRAVELLGPASNPWVHLRRFDLLALPSRDDPFPLVVLEAMLLGTPVVAFDVGGVRRQVGDAGLVVPPEDVEALAGAISRLLGDATERARLGAAARERAQRLFSSAAFGELLERVVLDASCRPSTDRAAAA